jgi:para-aminobenzoate synthetase component 1
MRVAEISYRSDSAPMLEAVRKLVWPAFLHSGREYLPSARFDIVTADPYVRITTRGDVTEVAERQRVYLTALDPLEVARQYLNAGPSHESLAYVPFTGGALGYLGYDFGRRYERIGENALADIRLPEVALGIYDWAVVVDHFVQRAWLFGHGNDPQTFLSWDELCDRFASPPATTCAPFEVVSHVESNLPREQYAEAFDAVKRHIEAGDCYQINLTQRFSAQVRGDAWDAYRRLREFSPAPYSAYLQYPFAQIVSSSPEQFVSVVHGHAVTKPIKGTRPRVPDKALDVEQAEQLASSVKDRAENVMIVDLLRNDFGRVCSAGSIEATRLFDVESFANVHHLVSTVEGDLRNDADALDLLEACFPGGSITGAPKVRSMQIIESIEPHRRSVYCGAIGYVGFDGNMDTSIVIRTLLVTAGKVYAWAGGGIVADSVLEDEYQESLDKAAAMLRLLSYSSPEG